MLTLPHNVTLKNAGRQQLSTVPFHYSSNTTVSLHARQSLVLLPPFPRRWFCDTCLRRFAKALSHGYPSAQHPNAVVLGRGRRQPQGVLAAADQFDDDDSGWGAASAPTRTSESRNNLTSDPSVVGLLGSDVIRTDGGRVAGGGAGRGGAWNGASAVEGPPTRFRTFTLSCARTAVTEMGARAAESISPGLMVVLED